MESPHDKNIELLKEMMAERSVSNALEFHLLKGSSDETEKKVGIFIMKCLSKTSQYQFTEEQRQELAKLGVFHGLSNVKPP